MAAGAGMATTLSWFFCAICIGISIALIYKKLPARRTATIVILWIATIVVVTNVTIYTESLIAQIP